MVLVFICLPYFIQHNVLQDCVAANGKILLFFMTEQYSIVYIYHIFTQSSVDGHLGCFRILAVADNATMSIGVYIFSNQSFFSFLLLQIQEWNWYIMWQFYFQLFERPPYCFSQWLYQFTFLLIVYEGFLSSTSSPTLAICILFIIAILIRVR